MKLICSLVMAGLVAAEHMKVSDAGCDSSQQHYVGVLPYFNESND